VTPGQSDLAPTRDTPAVAKDFVGVQVALSPASATVGPLALVGVFQLPAEEIERIDVNPHRALVVALGSRDGTIVMAPFRNRVFFPDDVQAAGGLRRGYFTIELVDPKEPVPEGPYWASVSLGTQLSNVVGFGVASGPQAP
jgi:hypothetical protein